MNLEIVRQGETTGVMFAMAVQPTLFDKIIEEQREDPITIELIIRVQNNETSAFPIGENSELRMNGRLCVSKDSKLK